MIQPTDKLDVTLDAAQWDAVMRIMSQAPVPYAVVAPLLTEIQRQCMPRREPSLVEPEAAAD